MHVGQTDSSSVCSLLLWIITGKICTGPLRSVYSSKQILMRQEIEQVEENNSKVLALLERSMVDERGIKTGSGARA